MLRTTVPETSVAHSLINQGTCVSSPSVETLYKRPQIWNSSNMCNTSHQIGSSQWILLCCFCFWVFLKPGFFSSFLDVQGNLRVTFCGCSLQILTIIYTCIDFNGIWYTYTCDSHFILRSDQIRSVAHSCPTLCDPMNRSTPGLPVHHQLPEFTQTHVHRVSDAIQPFQPLSSPSPLAPNPSQHQSLFQ